MIICQVEEEEEEVEEVEEEEEEEVLIEGYRHKKCFSFTVSSHSTGYIEVQLCGLPDN